MHVLKDKLIAGQKTDPKAVVIAGIYQPSFNILQDRALSLPETSPELDHLSNVYEVNKNQCTAGLHDLRLSKNKGVGEPVLAETGADLIAKSAVFTSIAVNLPQTHQNNLKIIYRLSRAIHEQEKTLNNPNLQHDLEQAINVTLTETQSQPLSKEQITQLAQKGNETVNKPKDNTGKLAVVAAGFALAQGLGQLLSEEEPQEEDVSSGHTGFGGDLGALAGAVSGRFGKEETQIQPETVIPEPSVPSPPNIPFAGSLLKSFSSRMFSGIGKTIGNIFKRALDVGLTAATGGLSKIGKVALAIGKGLLSFLGGMFGGAKDPDSEMKSYKSASRWIMVLIAVPVMFLFISTIFDSTLKSTALVDQSQLVFDRPNNPDQTSPDLPVSPEPSIGLVSPSPTPRVDQLGIVPRGFPADSTCVRTLPGENSHRGSQLNAIDLGGFSDDTEDVMRATHPGIVIHADDHSNYGHTVIIEALDKRYVTYYGHMQIGSFYVRVGDRVDYETPLGFIDNTGKNPLGQLWGKHVHYELRGPLIALKPKVVAAKSGDFGQPGKILDYLPPRNQWACDPAR